MKTKKINSDVFNLQIKDYFEGMSLLLTFWLETVFAFSFLKNGTNF